MTSARASVALGLGLLFQQAKADDLAWKTAGGGPPPTTAYSSPIGQAPAAGPGLVFDSPPSRPIAPPTTTLPYTHRRPTPAAEGVSWRPVNAEMPMLPPGPPSLPAVPPGGPQSLPAPRPLPAEPSMSYPPIPGPALVPQLTPPVVADGKANAWSGQVWGTGSGTADLIPAGDPTCVVGAVHGPAIPVNHHVVGSPEVRLSRDYAPADLLGGPRAVGHVAADGFSDDSFASVEYLLWWVNRGNIPVLASTSPGGGFGFVGEPNARSLLGPGPFGPSFMDGVRVRAGTWFEQTCGLGVDASFFILGRRSEEFAVNSNQFPILTRPFFATNPGIAGPFGEQVAAPGLASGALVVDNSSALWGADVNLLRAGCRTCDSFRHAFAGFRHLNLDEGLGITEFITAGANAPLPEGTAILVRDSFIARNRFYGGQVGYAAGRSWGAVDVQGRASVALGVTHQELEIDGFQGVTPPGGATSVFAGGLLAAGPNLGTHSRDVFSVVPELSLNLGYRVSPRLRTFVGYNLLYWSNVVRPGDSIDLTVDATFVPNGPNVPFSGQFRPQPKFDSSDLWVHGVSFGAEFRW